MRGPWDHYAAFFKNRFHELNLFASNFFCTCVFLSFFVRIHAPPVGKNYRTMGIRFPEARKLKNAEIPRGVLLLPSMVGTLPSTPKAGTRQKIGRVRGRT